MMRLDALFDADGRTCNHDETRCTVSLLTDGHVTVNPDALFHTDGRATMIGQDAPFDVDRWTCYFDETLCAVPY